jgi:hypothetical protein
MFRAPHIRATVSALAWGTNFDAAHMSKVATLLRVADCLRQPIERTGACNINASGPGYGETGADPT